MNAKMLSAVLAGLVIFSGVLGILRMRAHNAVLRSQVAEQRATRLELMQLREENARRRVDFYRAAEENVARDKALRLELEEARRRVAALAIREPKQPPSDATGKEVRVPAHQSAAIDPNNRDPEKSPVRAEHFTNAGRATPSAAFQTVIWAAIKGEESVLRDVLTFDNPGRQKAEEILARLPPEGRGKYPTPESVGALVWMWLAENLHGMAFQVVGTTETDAMNAVVRTRTAGSEREGPVQMKRDPEGWRLVVSEGAIESFKRRMEGGAVVTPPKRQ